MLPTRLVSKNGAAGLLALLIAGFGVLATACSSGPSNANSVKVAIEGPMTGPQSSTGIDMWHGAQLAAAKINNAGGILGQRVQLVRVDDQALPATAVAVARGAIRRHISAVVGPYNSAVGILNLPVYLHAGVPVVRLTSSHSTSGMGITLQPMDYQVAPFEAAAVEKMAGAQRVAIVYDSSTYTSGVAEQMKSLLTSAKIPVVSFLSFASDQTQFSDVLATVKAAQPTIVYYDAFDPQAEDLVQQASTLGVPGTCLVDGLAAEGPTFLKTVPLALAKKCVFSGVPTANQFAAARSYDSAYRATYHVDPGTWGTFTYDSLGALARAVEEAKSWAPQKLNPVLFHLNGYRGITGTTTINPATGDRDNPPLVMQTVDSSGHYAVSQEWSKTGALPALPAL